MEVGAEVWVADDKDVWATAHVAEIGATSVTVRLASGTTKTIPTDDAKQKNAGLSAKSAGGRGGVDDLTELNHLHEPAILQVLETRFSNDCIYTNTGPILIAVNPFQRLSLYSDEIMSEYFTVGLLRSTTTAGSTDHSPKLPPHVFATADNAYRCMMDIDGSRAPGAPSRNQSVLVSGESGAGKTETTKLVMRYLSSLGRPRGTVRTDSHLIRPHLGTIAGNDDEEEDGLDFDLPEEASVGTSGSGDALGALSPSVAARMPSVERRVLQSNPILEAFGNAKTTRNENSSRFGKFILLQFTRTGELAGATIQTYLLEKVRLAFQSEGERNYHIFYQIMAGLPAPQLEALGLRGAKGHALTSASGTTELRDVSDAEVFEHTVDAMNTMGINARQREAIWQVLAALVHMGDLRFIKGSAGEDSSKLDPAVASITDLVSRLFGCSPAALEDALTGKRIKVGSEMIRTLFSPAQSKNATEALAKITYGVLFDWLVSRINQRTAAPQGRSPLFIGVLDIFGFEHFKHNSFEQLCINFANETLQQHFNSYMFKLEQEEYEREGIRWSALDFEDNQDCLDLIEGAKPPGVFALLDQECKLMPKAPKADDKRTEQQRSADTASKFNSKLHDAFSTNKRFPSNPKLRRDSAFIIVHYAGHVTYDSLGFVEKNMEDIHKEATDLMATSSQDVLRAAYVDAFGGGPTSDGPTAGAAAASTSASSTAGPTKETVASQFKRQLRELMTIVRSTTPHYIRCIKPNAAQVPKAFERPGIVAQLRCGGVLEAVRVARLGFPVRFAHLDLVRNFRALAPDLGAILPYIATNHSPASKAGTPSTHGGAASGAGGSASAASAGAAAATTPAGPSRMRTLSSIGSAVSSAAADILHAAGLVDGSYQIGKTKVFFRKAAYDQLQAALIARLGHVITTIQCAWRRHRAIQVASRRRTAIILIQSFRRQVVARRVVDAIRRHRAATRIAAFARRSFAHNRYLRLRSAALRLQSAWRGFCQRRIYAQMRRQRAGLRLQAWLRGSVQRSRFTSYRRSAIRIQCAIRSALARQKLAKLRKEAREVGNLRETNVALREEVRQLSWRLDGVASQLAALLGGQLLSEEQRRAFAVESQWDSTGELRFFARSAAALDEGSDRDKVIPSPPSVLLPVRSADHFEEESKEAAAAPADAPGVSLSAIWHEVIRAAQERVISTIPPRVVREVGPPDPAVVSALQAASLRADEAEREVARQRLELDEARASLDKLRSDLEEASRQSHTVTAMPVHEGAVGMSPPAVVAAAAAAVSADVEALRRELLDARQEIARLRELSLASHETAPSSAVVESAGVVHAGAGDAALRSAQNEVRTTRKMLETVQEEAMRALEQIAQLENERKRLIGSVDNAQDELTSLRARVSGEVETARATAMAESTALIQAWKRRAEESEARLKDLEATVAESGGVAATRGSAAAHHVAERRQHKIEAQLQSAKREADSANKKMLSLEKDNDELRRKLAEQEQAKRELAAANAKLRRDVEDLQTDTVSAYQTQVDKLTRLVTEADVKMKAHVAERFKLAAELERVMREKEELASRVTDLSDSIAASEVHRQMDRETKTTLAKRLDIVMSERVEALAMVDEWKTRALEAEKLVDEMTAASNEFHTPDARATAPRALSRAPPPKPATSGSPETAVEAARIRGLGPGVQAASDTVGVRRASSTVTGAPTRGAVPPGTVASRDSSVGASPVASPAPAAGGFLSFLGLSGSASTARPRG